MFHVSFIPAFFFLRELIMLFVRPSAIGPVGFSGRLNPEVGQRGINTLPSVLFPCCRHEHFQLRYPIHWQPLRSQHIPKKVNITKC